MLVDREGYRQNVGIIICDCTDRLLWAKRRNQNIWQFPQGGIDSGESIEQAMYRELFEEVGLRTQEVSVLSRTYHWLYYRLPKYMIRQQNRPVYIGQKQKWFLLQLNHDDNCINVRASRYPEFDDWRWVSYWYPVGQAAPFKRHIYQRVLREFAAVVMLPRHTGINSCLNPHEL